MKNLNLFLDISIDFLLWYESCTPGYHSYMTVGKFSNPTSVNLYLIYFENPETRIYFILFSQIFHKKNEIIGRFCWQHHFWSIQFEGKRENWYWISKLFHFFSANFHCIEQFRFCFERTTQKKILNWMMIYLSDRIKSN